MLLLCACSATLADMDARDYIRWYRNNEQLNISKTYPGHEFTATYKTPELIILTEQGGNDLKADVFKKRKAELGNLSYFNFKIRTNENEDLFIVAGYNNVDYPVDLMQADFYLVQEKDTAYCQLYHFERNFGLSPVTNISLAFDTEKFDKASDFTLVFNDEIFRTGINKFLFRTSAIHSIPKLRINDYEN